MVLLDDKLLRSVLADATTIAIVGAKDKAGQPVDRVGRYLIEAGYEVIPVHPKRTNVWGLETYVQLGAIPKPVDVVDVFRAPEYCVDHAKEAVNLAMKPRLFWLQSGIVCPGAMELVQGAGIMGVQDRCLMVEHGRLFQ